MFMLIKTIRVIRKKGALIYTIYYRDLTHQICYIFGAIRRMFLAFFFGAKELTDKRFSKLVSTDAVHNISELRIMPRIMLGVMRY